MNPSSPGSARATPAASEDKVADRKGAGLNRAVLDQQLELEGGVVTDVGLDEGSSPQDQQPDAFAAASPKTKAWLPVTAELAVDPGQVAPIAAGQAVRLTSAS